MKGKILRKIPYFIIFHGKIHGFRCRFSETHHVLWWDDEWGSRHTEPAGDMENPLSTLEAWTGAGTWGPRPGGHLQRVPHGWWHSRDDFMTSQVRYEAFLSLLSGCPFFAGFTLVLNHLWPTKPPYGWYIAPYRFKLPGLLLQAMVNDNHKGWQNGPVHLFSARFPALYFACWGTSLRVIPLSKWLVTLVNTSPKVLSI